MKNSIQLLSIFILLASLNQTAVAQPHQHDGNHQHPEHTTDTTISTKPNPDADCGNLVKASVNGLVCDFCARALEKVFGKQAAVTGIEVNLDEGQISIELKSGQNMADEDIKQLIIDSGYNVTAINRDCPHEA